MSLEDNQFLLFDPGDGGASMEVPVRRESAFREKFPNARRLQLFDVGDGGEAMEVPEDRLDAFRAKYPKAERLYLFDEKDGGAAMEVPRAKLGAYIQKKAGPDKDRSWASYAGEAYSDAAKAVGKGATAVGRVVGAAVAGAAQGVAGTIADIGPGDAARRERQRALDAAPERIPTMKEAGREIGLSQKEIDALPDRLVTLRDLDDPRFGQAYRDRVRATMRRVSANAPETEAEKAHREEAERLQAKADKLSAPLMEPRNAAERAAMHFGGGVATVGELGLAGALGGPAAVPLWMGATGAAREAARQEAEGKTPREAMAGALAPAGAEALAWTVPVPVGQGATALGRVGREALTMGVKSDLAGTARRTLSGEEAPALSDRIAEDLGAAAMGGALGAAREGARAAGGAVVRAIEGDARNRAAKVAALDPAGTLGRAAEAATPPEYREAARNLEAAAVPESPMDAYARRKAAEANPASDFAGEAGREFLARGARELGDREAAARRSAEEELAPAEVPQVPVDEVPPTVPPEARGGVETPPPAPVPAPAAPVAGSATPPRAKRTRKPKAASPVAVSTTPPQAPEAILGPVAATDRETQAANLRGAADRNDALVSKFNDWSRTKEGAAAIEAARVAEGKLAKARAAVDAARRAMDKARAASEAKPNDKGLANAQAAADHEYSVAYDEYRIALSEANHANAVVSRPIDFGADLRGRADRIGEEPLPGRPEGAGAGRAVVEKDGKVPVVRGEGLPTGATVREQMPQQREWLKEAVKVAANQAFEGRRTGGKSAKGANVSSLYDTNIPKGVPTKVRIEIPGDGKFTLVNEKHVIEEWGKRMDQALAPSALARPSISTGAASPRGEVKPAKNAPASFARPDATKLLAPFAGKEHPQAILNEPFGDGEFAYATDGRYFARLRSRGEPFKKKGATAEVNGVVNGLNTYLNAERNLLGDFEVASALRNVREMIASGDGKPVVVGIGRDGELAFATLATEYGDAAGAARAGEFSPTGEQIGVFNPEYFATILELAAKTGNARIELGRPVKGDPILLVRGPRGNMDAGLMPFQNVEGGPEGMAKRVGSELGELSDRPAAPFRTRAAGARADVAAETPRAAGAPAPESPHEGLRTKLRVLVDSGATPDELEAFAREAEASDAFATAALARQRAGTYRGTPWGTEGGDVWPAEPPPMAKLELGDMVDLARELSASGAVPRVVRKISRILGGRAAGVFRNTEGVPTSGKVEMLSRFAALVDKSERAAIEDRALARAKATGAEPGSEMFQAAYDKALADGLGKAVEASLKAGPKPAMAVLAHEIGHWVDFLDEGTLKRGNVLGHIAALKKYGARNLYPSQAAADAAGSPKLTKEEVRARAVEMTDPQESFKTKLDWLKAVSKNESAARAALIAERDMATLPQMREQMERLVAWFRQSDGAPEYFAKDPSELYAEAFSAWMNYPSNARRLAPRFADLMDGWIESHGAAGRAVRRFQTLAAERSAAREAAAAAGGTPPVDEAFFERRRKESAAASLAEDPALRKILAEDKDPIPKWKRNLGSFLNNYVGPRTMLEDLILGAPDAKKNPAALPVFRALQDLDNAGNMGRLWHYRFQTRVMPKLEAAGIPLDDFRDFLKYRRLGWEITGEAMDKGAANKFGPGGVSPGYQATGARARVEALRAKYGRALDDAADTFFDDVRMGADAGGEGSILKRLMESPVLSAKQKETLGNRLYVSLARAMVPDTTREVTSAREMKNWNGIWRLSTGSFQETGDVIANTLLQDTTMFPLVMRQEARLRLVDYLREKMPEWVGGPAEMKVIARTDEDGNPFHQSVPKQQARPGWRVVTFNRDGKTEGWWLPDFVAKGLEPQTFAADKTTSERDADAAWAKLSRASNASLTTGNLVFNPVNALARDPNGLSRYALPRRGEGVKGALYNTVGDVSLGLRSLFDKTATNLERGVYDPRAVHALASGALNDTAAGWGPNGGTGGVAAMAEDIRRQGRSELTEDELRRFWQGFGNRPERVDAALRKEGSKIEKAAGQVEKIWNTYAPGRVNQWLGKREMASKAASLADLEARYPDMSPEERNWWVKNMMGTPDLANRPLYDRNPRFRAALPFWTPFVHGIRYQVMRAFQKIPGTLGRRLATQMMPKVLAIAAPTIGILMARHYYEEYKRMKASGRYSQDAIDEQLASAARWTAFGQAYAGIPLRHRIGGFTAPLPGGYYYYQPTDQGLLALEALALGTLGGATKQGSYKEGILGAINEFLPNVGPIPNTAIGLATTANGRGFDLNMGTPIVGEREQHPALRTAGWAYNNLTGRGLGILPAETIEGWITGTGPTAGEAARRAWKFPLMSAFPGAFIRKRGSGEWAARAGATRQEQAEETEMRSEATQGAAAGLRIQERNEKGKPDAEADRKDAERVSAAGRRIQELGGDATARLNSAADRQRLAAKDLSPSERLIVEKKGKLSDAAKEWLDPAAHAMLEMPEVWQKLHEKPEE